LEDKGKPCIFIGEGEIDATPEELYCLVSDNTYRSSYDNLFEEG